MIKTSPAGRIVQESLASISDIFPGVTLGEHIVMPNHFHAIISFAHPVQTPHGGVSHIINQLKGHCTKQIRSRYLPGFSWHPRFWDHIIRNEDSLKKISEYIRNNPLKWDADEYNI